MSLTIKEATDEILEMARTSVSGSGYEVEWENIRNQNIPSNDPWWQIIIRHAIGGQRTLGGEGNRLFERNGELIIALFDPAGKGLSESYNLAKPILDTFEGKSSPSGVWFRDSRILEVGKNGNYYETQFITDFSYHEMK